MKTTIIKQIEKDFILLNHANFIKIIDDHFDVIKNDMEEDKETWKLMDSPKAYQQ